MLEADVIIVGAGTAGCVLANRLSHDQGRRVLVLEAGGNDHSPIITAPGGVWPLMHSGAFSFRYRTAPQTHLDGRTFTISRGKVLGGSSSTNGMVYSRGCAQDYARWHEQGLQDWSYAQVLPYFRKLETHPFGPSPFHGATGPMRITRPGVRHPLSKAFLEAAAQNGFAMNPDTDGAQREGFGPLDLMTWRSRRWSTSVGYLRPALSRATLRVLKHAQATRILFEGDTARGVAFRHNGRATEARAPEVILCAGAIESPHLLLLSGIGGPEQLREVGLPVLHDLPGVGRNLQDHVAVALKCAISQPITMLRYRNPLRLVQALAEYVLLKRGPLANPGFEVVGFARSDPALPQPDLRFQLVLALLRRDKDRMLPTHGFQIRASLVRPVSVGSVRLACADPLTAPVVDQNYLSEPQERRALRQAVRIMRDLWNAPAFDPFRGTELEPGVDCTSDAALDAYIRTQADPDYHSVGTCRMGTDALAVVDERFRVHGLRGLRVVDASVMPSIVDTGTCIPTIMIAERAADAILGGT